MKERKGISRPAKVAGVRYAYSLPVDVSFTDRIDWSQATRALRYGTLYKPVWNSGGDADVRRPQVGAACNATSLRQL